MRLFFFHLCITCLLCSTGSHAALAANDLAALLNSMGTRAYSDPVAVSAELAAAKPLLVSADSATQLLFYLRSAQAHRNLFMYDQFTQDVASARGVMSAEVPIEQQVLVESYEGVIELDRGNLQRAEELLTAAAQRAQEHDVQRIFVYAVQELAYTRGLLQRFEQSLMDLQRAYVAALQLNEPYLIAQVHDAYGALYGYMLDYPRAIEYYSLALAEFEQLGFKAQIASAIEGLASVHRDFGQWREAETYYERYLNFTQYASGYYHLFLGNYGLAVTYALQGDCGQALPQIELSLALEGPIDYKAELFKYRAQCEALGGDFQAADVALARATKILKGFPELEGTTWMLDLDRVGALLEFHRGNPQQAYQLLQHYHTGYVRLSEKNSSDKLNMLRTGLENTRKDLEIALLEEQAQVSVLLVEAQSQENVLQRYLIGLWVAIAAVILLGLLIQRRNNKRILALSNRDGLSGLYNRRYTFNYMQRVIPHISVAEGGLAIILMDIDDFKQINDQHGHPMGDEVIKRIAEVGELLLRNRDIMGRVGGEEFLCVLPRATAKQSEQIAQRLLKAITAERFCSSEGITFSTSVSIGIANYDPSVSSADQLYNYADKALYRSKEAGKNRITTYRR